jgi:hypothetical protein
MQQESNTSLASAFACRFFTTPQQKLDENQK